MAPIPIVAWWAGGAPSGPDARAIAVCVLVAVWGIRLTANWAARWRGLADEDFRYAEIRARTGRLYWPASLAAIHLLPTAWVFLGLLAAWPALASHGRPAGALDAVALAVTAGGIAVEAIADRQLRRFLRSRRDPSCVLETGLWRFSRHPNYFGEITFWWGLWLFGLAADPRWAWTAVGPVAITLLFALVSIPWMDRRMLSVTRVGGADVELIPAPLAPPPLDPADRRRRIGAARSPDTAAEPGAPDLDALRRRYGGEYEFVGGSAERASVPAAVERSVQGMFFIARGIAYDRLLQSSQVCDHYTFDLGAGSISVAELVPDSGRQPGRRPGGGAPDPARRNQQGEPALRGRDAGPGVSRGRGRTQGRVVAPARRDHAALPRGHQQQAPPPAGRLHPHLPAEERQQRFGGRRLRRRGALTWNTPAHAAPTQDVMRARSLRSPA